MRLPRLFLLLSRTFPNRFLEILTLRQDRLGRFPTSSQNLGTRPLVCQALTSVLLPELGPCQSAVLLGSSERRTSGNWHPASHRH